jgi:predicted RNase H-like HicB family nuclease
MEEPRIMIQEKVLSILLALDGEKYCAYCPELDLVTEMDTPEKAIADMIEAIKDYAEEYMEDIELYSKSPNRAHHLPYIKTISACKSDWELRMLIEIKHGLVHI